MNNAFNAIKALVSGPTSYALPEAAPLATVASVDLSRYLGKWFEYAKIPTPFQPPGGTNTTATYTLNDDGASVHVRNATFIGGKESSIEGKAWVAEPEVSSAKLKVQFFWPFSGDYWVIQLGDAEDYGYAVVGNPGRTSCWVLSRTPTMPEEQYKGILEKLTEQGYDNSGLTKTEHSEVKA